MNRFESFFPKINSEFLMYKRTETDGGATLKFASSEIPTKSVNKQFNEIINLCTGRNSLSDIIAAQCSKYNDVSQSVIEKDVTYVLHSLSKLGVLDSKNNPYFQEVEWSLNNRISLISGGDEIISTIRKFIFSNPDKEIYRNLISSGGLFGSLVQGRALTESGHGYPFYIKEDGKVSGVIIWGSVIPTIFNLEYANAVLDETFLSCLELSKTMINELYPANNYFSINFIENETNDYTMMRELLAESKTQLIQKELINSDLLEIQLA